MRNHSDAQPHRKLTDAGWEDLYREYKKRTGVSVAALCKEAGVSKARFYVKFGARIAAEKTGAPGSEPTTGR